MEKFDESTKCAADRIEALADARLELVELTPSRQNSLDDSMMANLHDARKLEHTKQKICRCLIDEWLSLNNTERKRVAEILENRNKEQRKFEPSAHRIIDHTGKVSGIEFESSAEPSHRTKLEVNDFGKCATVTVDEGPQLFDFWLNLFGRETKPHAYTDVKVKS